LPSFQHVDLAQIMAPTVLQLPIKTKMLVLVSGREQETAGASHEGKSPTAKIISKNQNLLAKLSVYIFRSKKGQPNCKFTATSYMIAIVVQLMLSSKRRGI